MKTKLSFLFISFFSLFLFQSCNEETTADKDTLVLIETPFGDIKAKLYKETPEHRNNFIALAEKGFYDDVLFHRVIKNFMIQGGDPDSKNAKPDILLGQGGPNYKIPAEILPQYFHKRGALAAARQGDVTNPKKMSSGSQFYIVTGNKFTGSQIDKIEQQAVINKRNKRIENLLYTNMTTMKVIDSLRRNDMKAELDSIWNKAGKKVDNEFKNEKKFSIPQAHRDIYSTQGGAPFLDGGYSVFGEVIEGFDVLDKISNSKTGKNDRPEKNIKMKVTILK